MKSIKKYEDSVTAYTHTHTHT